MKTFLFIEARPIECAGIGYIRRLGYAPVLFTSMQSMNKGLFDDLDLSLFDEVHHVDTRDARAMRERIAELRMSVGAVLGCYDDVMIPGSELAGALGLPHPSLAGLRNAYSKKRVRDTLHANGYRQPGYQVLSADRFPPRPDIGFPCVLKPLRDAGAYGVSLCANEADYRAAVERLRSGDGVSMLGNRHREFLAEEFLEGPFYGAELLHNQGRWHVLGINRIFVSPHDSLCMTGISHPSDLPAVDAEAIAGEIVDWVNLLGLAGGALNVEFILTERGPALVEVNLRIAGARAVRQIMLTTGIDMVEHLIDFVCGIDRPIVPRESMRYDFVADAFVFAPAPGIVHDIAFAPRDAHYVASGFRKVPLESTSASKNFGSVIGYVLAHGRTCDEAMRHARALADDVRVDLG
ncbi:ATP-grasp domain-containing protein [Burkholderia oklahomensis]|uniref:ATP-grasp domain protein n=1 Tax=Burkholderia oklahomensis TaxID=342113 RepID=A0AAI8B3F2_9BURK|nr:ATP-grasp domain-containing protein [Burkholderia oklahomensis]AIO64967.1 ATP-grasp domain protein [Burkholderia oklahomensis]AJX31197.1 ATP-grasp domain protein [Burkholderia oklahomensis C6786]AOI43474.1 carboxylate--amine ligase [Burkholderia oklahomensis EO147]AOI47041.1 carboxylate--amine ligase [Burkholderia oklahomensis C6786]KUY54012.1 carboxylate--amine ligase [Burkholderia oklahomensis EO147]